jgi:hypothetical protein
MYSLEVVEVVAVVHFFSVLDDLHADLHADDGGHEVATNIILTLII